jgi:3-deoxy-7-phosphoheptulonate synthase
VANPQIHNVNVADQRVLISPEALREAVEIPDSLYQFVSGSRATIEQIIDRQDHRLIVVVGPCSIHDVTAALDYANRLKELAERVAENLYLVMRVYFEKPRTTVGWKGLINDPSLDDSFDIENGLKIGRTLLRGYSGAGPADSHRSPRPHHPTVSERPHQLVSDWRADDRITDPPRNGQWPLVSSGL